MAVHFHESESDSHRHDQGPPVRQPGEAAARPGRGRWSRWGYTLPGAWVALAFACLSLTPSLLPRPAAFQGLVTGLSAATGYGLGVFGAWLWREFADREARVPGRRAWQIFAVVAAMALVVSFLLGQMWQRQIRALMGVPGGSPLLLLLIPVLAALVFVLAVGLGRGLRRLYRWFAELFARRMGARAARATGLLVVVALTAYLVSGVLLNGLMSLADRTFGLRDLSTPEGVVKPTGALRSGGPGSLVPWDTLGRQGRVFTAEGPTAKEISAFTGVPAKEPIRVYAGYASAGDTEERAELAVRDLERAGGFDRRYLLLVTTTGSGWVEPTSVGAFEYMTGGDSAIVAMQYSHLPSWISYLVDQDRAREAGRELFDALYGRWSQLPIADRPKLLVFGESLGSFGAETAFSGENDLANRTDGALLVGPPNFNALYRELTDGRDPRSPEIEPVYRDGRTVRFSTQATQGIPPTGAPWVNSRVLYLQHPSDPIVWWSPQLLWSKPDWLREPRGRDVVPAMVWIPFVTFWQVSADLPLGMDVPPGHGHVYRGEHVAGWAAVLHPEGWTAEKTTRLQGIIR